MKNLAVEFADILVEIGMKYPEVIVVDADLPDSCNTEKFAKNFPDRVWDIGIAEQSLPTISAGLALCGKIPVYNSFAVFAVHRGVDMIRQSICYNNANVKIVGHAAGVSMGYTGPSHHTIEDIALLRAFPGMCILQPSDAVELKQMMFATIEHNGPVYLRLPRSTVPTYHTDDYEFKIGQPDLISEGTDISLFFTGDLYAKVMEIVSALEYGKISVQVVNLPSIKPLDVNAIIQLGKITRAAVTLEDHNIIGGMGSMIAEIYAEYLQKPVKRMGINDTFTESADADLLRERYGLGNKTILKAISTLLNNQ
tara:strand:+ start:675 stop:1604 length:930 start_codon:yes stop_codon:yes gene_type:complete